MQVVPEEGTQEGGVQKDEGRSRCRQMRQEWQAKRLPVYHSLQNDYRNAWCRFDFFELFFRINKNRSGKILSREFFFEITDVVFP